MMKRNQKKIKNIKKYQKNRKFLKKKMSHLKSKKDVYDLISKIAKEESVYFNPNQSNFELNMEQVYFKIRDNIIIHIEKKNDGKTFLNRYEILLFFIKSVLKDKKYRIHGDFIFFLGDMSDNNNNNEIVFSKNKNTQKSLMPDGYAMNFYQKIPKKKDEKSFFKKNKRGYFIGTSTGNIDPLMNDRLIYANYSHNNPSLFKCELNHICQIPLEKIQQTYPLYSKFILNKNKTIEEQREKYSYIIDIDGNTCSWDRMVWIMKSNCICLKKRSDNMNWYYPLLKKDLHYYEFNSPEELNSLIQKLNKMTKKNKNRIRNQIKETKKFVSTFLHTSSHLHYFGQLLHYISEKFIDLS